MAKFLNGDELLGGVIYADSQERRYADFEYRLLRTRRRLARHRSCWWDHVLAKRKDPGRRVKLKIAPPPRRVVDFTRLAGFIALLFPFAGFFAA
jgi:hypothetical protein